MKNYGTKYSNQRGYSMSLGEIPPVGKIEPKELVFIVRGSNVEIQGNDWDSESGEAMVTISETIVGNLRFKLDYARAGFINSLRFIYKGYNGRAKSDITKKITKKADGTIITTCGLFLGPGETSCSISIYFGQEKVTTITLNKDVREVEEVMDVEEVTGSGFIVPQNLRFRATNTKKVITDTYVWDKDTGTATIQIPENAKGDLDCMLQGQGISQTTPVRVLYGDGTDYVCGSTKTHERLPGVWCETRCDLYLDETEDSCEVWLNDENNNRLTTIVIEKNEDLNVNPMIHELSFITRHGNIGCYLENSTRIRIPRSCVEEKGQGQLTFRISPRVCGNFRLSTNRGHVNSVSQFYRGSGTQITTKGYEFGKSTVESFELYCNDDHILDIVVEVYDR